MSQTVQDEFKEYIQNCDIEKFKSHIEGLKARKIGCSGGRKFYSLSYKGSVTANEIVKNFNELVYKFVVNHLNKTTREYFTQIRESIEKLDTAGDEELKKANILRRALTSIKRFFGNQFFKRNVVLNSIKNYVSA